MARARVLALALAGFGCVQAMAADSPVIDSQAALERSQAAIGRKLPELTLVASDGSVVRLAEYRGKPLLISLIYTSCYHTCPAITRELADAVHIAREALGEGFEVLSVGFDSEDTPERMRSFAREQRIDEAHWRFAAGDRATIASLVDALGFTYAPSPRGFDHLTQTTLVDHNGVVHQQVYGEPIYPPALVEPLKQLIWGIEADPSTMQGWLKGVKLFCTTFDPTTGRYRFDYSVFVSITIAVVVTVAGGVFVYRAWTESRTGGSA